MVNPMKSSLLPRDCRESPIRLTRFAMRLIVWAVALGTMVPPRVAGDPPVVDDYTAWIQQKFPTSYGNPALESSVWGPNADPDQDACGNLMEFVMHRDPNTNDSHLGMTSRIDGNDLVATFRETASTNPGVMWLGEWSVDLGFWMAAGVRYETIETHAGYRLVEARVSRNREKVMYLRLTARR